MTTNQYKFKSGISSQMYEGAPWCLGRYDSFEVDQPKLIKLLGHDYVIWRDKSGKLNALDNICPHAGANLAKGGYVVNFQGKDCLACPYHGNKVKFFGDGKVIIDDSISNRAIQTVLPLQIIDGFVWTYGLNWQEQNGKLIAKSIEPKLPIPDYQYVPNLPEGYSQIEIKKLIHMSSDSKSLKCNIEQVMWNIHDGEHFAGTHRDSMLSQEIKIDNLIQDENKISWKLTLFKRGDRAAKRNKMNLLMAPVFTQYINTFLPSLAVTAIEFKGQLTLSFIMIYPESDKSIRMCLNTFTNRDFSWWQKLLRIPQASNAISDRLFMEDIAIMENLYLNFEQKIALKNDTPIQLAMNYLRNWNN